MSGEIYYTYKENDYFLKKKRNEISISVRSVEDRDWFSPILEIANTNNNCYDESVYDVVWRTRKSINEWLYETK